MWPAVALIRLCLSLISTLENASQNSTATQVPSLLFFLYSLAHSFLSSPSLSVILLPLSEVVTQVKFSTDCRFLYSVSGDGYVT
jgi:hypothetical protein